MAYGFLSNEEKYDALKQKQGWFDETPLETLAEAIIQELREELTAEQTAVASCQAEVWVYEGRIDELETELETERERSNNDEVEELETEVEFLKTLVTDMEEELAALDVAV